MFKWVTDTRKFPPLSHMGGLALLIALWFAAGPLHLSALALGGGDDGGVRDRGRVGDGYVAAGEGSGDGALNLRRHP